MKMLKISVMIWLLIIFMPCLSPSLFAGSTLSTKPVSKSAVESSSSTEQVKKNKCEPLKINMPSNLPDGKENGLYKIEIKISGGVKPFSFNKVSQSVLPELKFSHEGILSGKLNKQGTYIVKVKVSDSCLPIQTVEKTFKFIVTPEVTKKSMEKRTTEVSTKTSSVKSIIHPVVTPTMTVPKSKAGVPETMAEKLSGEFALDKVNPSIESVFTVPVGSLRPGSKLYVKGKNFGEYTGKILMYRYSSPIELINVEWTNEKNVNGIVPDDTKVWQNQEVEIKVLTYEKRYSNPMKMGFISTEEAWLGMEDVIVENCDFADRGYCNGVEKFKPCDADFAGPPTTDIPIAVTGMHCLRWGALNDETGVDRYSISLKNGWAIMGVVPLQNVSKKNEAWIKGPLPSGPSVIGKSKWTFEYKWTLTPNDKLFYKLGIRVEGPVGTTYK